LENEPKRNRPGRSKLSRGPEEGQERGQVGEGSREKTELDPERRRAAKRAR